MASSGRVPSWLILPRCVQSLPRLLMRTPKQRKPGAVVVGRAGRPARDRAIDSPPEGHRTKDSARVPTPDLPW